MKVVEGCHLSEIFIGPIKHLIEILCHNPIMSADMSDIAAFNGYLDLFLLSFLLVEINFARKPIEVI